MIRRPDLLVDRKFSKEEMKIINELKTKMRRKREENNNGLYKKILKMYS